MTEGETHALSPDFWKFWAGQTISNLGSSFAQWAVPILVYQLTHSAVNLRIATAAVGDAQRFVDERKVEEQQAAAEREAVPA